MGLIEAFTAVANANPAEKADLLSASISVAMNTTAFGLMSAIPLLLFHAKLTSTTGQIVDSLEMASVKALNSISDFNRRHFVKKSEPPDENQQISNRKPQVGTAPQSLSTKQAPVKSQQAR
jgi:biopolymer transport protein ExbB